MSLHFHVSLHCLVKCKCQNAFDADATVTITLVTVARAVVRYTANKVFPRSVQFTLYHDICGQT